MLELIISLASGAIGGNLAGGVLKNFNQGTLTNSVVGILGGGLGGTILSTLSGGAVDAGSASSLAGILSAVASGGVGGGVGLAIVSMIRKAIGK